MLHQCKCEDGEISSKALQRLSNIFGSFVNIFGNVQRYWNTNHAAACLRKEHVDNHK